MTPKNKQEAARQAYEKGKKYTPQQQS